MSPRPGRLGILTVIARKRVASPYRALTFSGRLELYTAAGGHIRFGIIRDQGSQSPTTAHVRFASESGLRDLSRHVRFVPEAD